ncbi:hypothetical protein PCE1_005024 [Barthelona sp. PCE]
MTNKGYDITEAQAFGAFEWTKPNPNIFQKAFRNTIGLVLVPIRFLCWNIVLFFIAIFAVIAMIGADKKDVTKHPIRQWLIVKWSRAWVRVGLFLSGFFWIKVKGERDPDASVFITNHQSWCDPCCAIMELGAGFISKIENKKVYGVGIIAQCIGCIFVSRDSEESRKQAQEDLTAGIKNPDRTICVFPEGTITNTKHLSSFKTGVFVAGEPIQPILFRYDLGCMPPHWVAGNMFANYFKLCMNPWNGITIEYLPTYHPNEAEKANPQLYAHNMQKVMCDGLGVTAEVTGYQEHRCALDYYNGKLTWEEAVDKVIGVRKTRYEKHKKFVQESGAEDHCFVSYMGEEEETVEEPNEQLQEEESTE